MRDWLAEWDEAESIEGSEGDGEVGVDKEGNGSEDELGGKRARDHNFGGGFLASVRLASGNFESFW